LLALGKIAELQGDSIERRSYQQVLAIARSSDDIAEPLFSLARCVEVGDRPCGHYFEEMLNE
jgi:hypothetical protein